MYIKKFKVWALARAETYVSLNHTGSYTNVPAIFFDIDIDIDTDIDIDIDIGIDIDIDMYTKRF